MGSARWNPSDWNTYASTTSTKTRSAIFTARGIKDGLNPLNIKVRESVDSAANPRSTPIIVALDETGSMGEIPEALIKGSLGTFIDEIYARKPVSDPHLMFMGIGDAFYDNAPLQVTQFESDITIAKQLAQIYLEGNGGGNSSESYHLAWYFAGMHTRLDSMIKRNKRGYLFTVGDEEVPPALTREQIKKIVGDDVERDFTPAELLAMAERSYHVFHVVVEQGNHCRDSHRREKVFTGWRALMGQRVIPLSDYTRLSEVLVSTIAMNEGAIAADVADSWKGDTKMVVAHALKGMMAANNPTQDLVRF